MEGKLERLIATAKSALRTYRKMNRSGSASDGSRKKFRNNQAEANECGRELSRNRHEMHCLAVEMGLAAPELGRYGYKLTDAGMGRQHRELYRYPDGCENLPDVKSELIDVCEDVMSDVELMIEMCAGVENKNHYTIETGKEISQKLRAAIAKARGES